MREGLEDSLVGTEVGRYRIERKLAAGGMGAVYLAVQPAIGSRVAIKVLADRCAADPALVERFFSEARAVNLIKHESIVNVLDMANLPDGRPYLVMELIDGESLGRIIRRPQPLPLGGVARAVGEALSALAAAHAIGIVHRDLKPDNIFITRKGHAKVIDFGIAKLARGIAHEHAPRTYTDDFLGTPAYMSPEQITNASTVDARADIYAIGVVLYEAVTGRVPFIGTTFEIMQAHVSEPPRPPRELRADLPAGFEAVILTALAKDPAHRFASVAAMQNALAGAARALAPAQQASLAPIVDDAAPAPSIDTPAAPSALTPAAPSAVVRPPRVRRRWPWLVAVAAIIGIAIVAIVVRGRAKAPLSKLREALVIADPSQFDIHALLPVAIEHARMRAPDAQLVEIQLNHVSKSGLVDLSQDSSIENRIVFVSATTKPCAIVMVLTRKGVRVERRDEPCKLRPVRPPRCRIGDARRGMISIGATTARYVGDPKPHWYFIGFPDEQEVDDDCKNNDTNGP